MTEKINESFLNPATANSKNERKAPSTVGSTNGVANSTVSNEQQQSSKPELSKSFSTVYQFGNRPQGNQIHPPQDIAGSNQVRRLGVIGGEQPKLQQGASLISQPGLLSQPSALYGSQAPHGVRPGVAPNPSYNMMGGQGSSIYNNQNRGPLAHNTSIISAAPGQGADCNPLQKNQSKADDSTNTHLSSSKQTTSGALVPTGVTPQAPYHMPISRSMPTTFLPPSNDADLPKLQNIVSTANLNAALDLHKISHHCQNVEYKPKRFAAAIMRIREPKTTALIFASGKMVCTGAKSEEQSETASKQYAKNICKVGFKDVKISDFKIQNIVGSHDVGFQIKLESLRVQAQTFCQYDPEMFPGLIFRMTDPKLVLLIFNSGKIVLTGAKKRDEIYLAYQNIKTLLASHKNEDQKPRLPDYVDRLNSGNKRKNV